MKGSTLRLTKIDDEIYDHLCKDFPEFDPAETIDENKLKSPTAKKRWRDFMMAYEKRVDDYSFGTMLRSSPKEEYTQHGTIFGKSIGHCSRSCSRSCSLRVHPPLDPPLWPSCNAAIPDSSGYGGQEISSLSRHKHLMKPGHLTGSGGSMGRC